MLIDCAVVICCPGKSSPIYNRQVSHHGPGGFTNLAWSNEDNGRRRRQSLFEGLAENSLLHPCYLGTSFPKYKDE